MSAGLMVYYVPAGALQAAFGSRDPELLHEYGASAEEFEDADARLAVVEFVRGRFLRRSHDDYAFAMKLLCERLGASADNAPFYPANEAYFDELDEHLNSVGLHSRIRFSKLVRGSSIEGLPMPHSQLVSLGCWRHAWIVEALPTIQAKKVSAALQERGVWETLNSWLARAAARREDIVGFFY
jgi:hypothetical protein